VIFVQCLVVFAGRLETAVLADFTVACLAVESVVCAFNLLGYPEWGRMGGRVVGSVGGPVFLGSWLAVSAPLVWASRYRRGGAVLVAFLLWATGARGAAVSIALASVAVLRPRWLVFALLLLPLAFTKGKAHSDNLRRVTWGIAARAGLDHPILGWGPDTFSIADREVKDARDLRPDDDINTANQSAHNDFLEVWVTLGGLGAAAYLFFLARLWPLILEMNPALAVSVVSLFIQAKVNPVANAALLWGAAVLACAG
jgi:O-antigen ligase